MENQTQNLEQTVQAALEPESKTVQAPVDSNPAPKEQETPEVQTNSDNSTIRQMREQIASANKERDTAKELLKRIADTQGISVDELEENIKQKEIQKQANSMNIPTEVAAQIRAQEERIKQLEEQTIKDDFNLRVDKLLSETKMTREQVITFLTDAQNRGFNPLQKGLDLTTLYNAINFDKISKAKEAEIRQNILNEMQAQRSNSNQIPEVKATEQTPSDGGEYSNKEYISDIINSFKK